jgi:hypothetical protein
MGGDVASKEVTAAMKLLNDAVERADLRKLATCFYESQAYWRDTVALTAHVRTFTTRGVITTAFFDDGGAQRYHNGLQLERAQFISATPVSIE